MVNPHKDHCENEHRRNNVLVYINDLATYGLFLQLYAYFFVHVADGIHVFSKPLTC